MPIAIPPARGGRRNRLGQPAVPRLHPVRARRRRLHRRAASSSRRITRRWRATTPAPARRAACALAFAVQDEPIGTANAVAAAEAWTGDDPFLVVNGDNYYAVRTLASLVGRAGAATALYRAETLLARSNIPADRIRAFALGVVEDGRLARIVEKPTPEQAAALGDAPRQHDLLADAAGDPRGLPARDALGARRVRAGGRGQHADRRRRPLRGGRRRGRRSSICPGAATSRPSSRRSAQA